MQASPLPLPLLLFLFGCQGVSQLAGNQAALQQQTLPLQRYQGVSLPAAKQSWMAHVLVLQVLRLLGCLVVSLPAAMQAEMAPALLLQVLHLLGFLDATLPAVKLHAMELSLLQLLHLLDCLGVTPAAKLAWKQAAQHSPLFGWPAVSLPAERAAVKMSLLLLREPGKICWLDVTLLWQVHP